MRSTSAIPRHAQSHSLTQADSQTDFAVPVPPVAEQERIVAAIEEQFSRLDAGVAALERVRQNLKRMRDSSHGCMNRPYRVIAAIEPLEEVSE